MKYDAVIIGGGPGGYTAAFTAAEHGLKTAVIEQKELGGTCLNRGCIPTKALVHSADFYREMKSCSELGFHVKDIEVNHDDLLERVNGIVSGLRDGLGKRMKAEKIDVYSTKGMIQDAHTVLAGEEVLETDNIIIAAGSVPSLPPIAGIDLPGVITSDDVLASFSMYESLVIIGGGVIGCEIAGIYEAFGTKVTIIETMDSLLPNMDTEAGRSLAVTLKKRGTDVHTKALVKKICKTEQGLTVTFEEKGKELEVQAEAVLAAAGRKAVTDCFLAEMPRLEKGRIWIDENGETSIKGIYAIGDAAYGYPQLAHTAAAMGVNAVCSILQKPHARDLRYIPSGVYTSPEIAAVGLMEKEASEQGFSVISGKVNTLANARSLIADSGRGFVKVIVEKETGILLGTVMMCERATDLIQEAALAIAEKKTVQDVLKVIHGHPTFAELYAQALEAALKKL